MQAWWLPLIAVCVGLQAATCTYVVDPSAKGRTFDGIGGLSGGGATSKLLVNYPSPYRDQVLDYLFKPDFAASLHIIKVEMGGDGDSTEGTEASHWHNEWEEYNYQRGYEWWVLTEAMKRNPDIKTYTMPWAWPGFLGTWDSTPYKNDTLTAQYIISWMMGARDVYNVDLDYIGIWNERPYNKDYIITLRQMMDDSGFQSTQIVASDSHWSIVKGVLENKTLFDAVDVIGVHYPGTTSPADAKATGKPLWSSEDYSTKNDDIGAGCWARIINQNYVVGAMTSTIAWNLVTSYYDQLPYPRCSLMTANEPWSGHYDVADTIWVTAHTTQFAQPGDSYLELDRGSGLLDNGGSYVSFASAGSDSLTIVIETMTHDHSICIRPALPAYNVSKQNATFKLSDSSQRKFFVTYSKLSYESGVPSQMFIEKEHIGVNSEGEFTLDLGLDEIWTLSEAKSGTKGQYGEPPASGSFPDEYSDAFDSEPEFSEPLNFVPQMGSFEIRKEGSNQFVQQTVLQSPVKWCNQGISRTMAVGGRGNAIHGKIEMSVRWPETNSSKQIFLGGWIHGASGTNLGCATGLSTGIYVYINRKGSFKIAENYVENDTVDKGSLSHDVEFDTWYQLALVIEGFNATHSSYEASFGGAAISKGSLVTKEGFFGFGTSEYGLAHFDNLQMSYTN